MSRVMKRLLALAAASIAALTLVAAGCAPSTPSAPEIVLKAVGAAQGVTSAKTAVSLSITADLTGGTQPGAAGVTLSGSGIVDVTGKKSAFSGDATVNAPGKDQQKFSTQLFMVDGWAYIQSSQSPGWVKIKHQAGATRTEGQPGPEMLLLRMASTAVSAGQEKVDGVQCYVLTVTPDANALLQWLLDQGGATGLQKPELGNLDMTKIAKDAKLKVWIETGTFLVRKVQGSVTLNVNPADLGAPSSSFAAMGAVVSGELGLTDYNAPVDIQLPAGALNAKEITGPTGK